MLYAYAIALFLQQAMTKLSVYKIISSAFIIPWKNLAHYSYALALPTLAMVSIWSLWIIVSPKTGLYNVLFYCAHLITFSYFAITCHRLILIEKNPGIALNTQILRALIGFTLLMIAIYVISAIIETMIINFYSWVFSDTAVVEINGVASHQQHTETNDEIRIIEYLAYIPAMYIFGRLSMVLPAIAVGRKISLSSSWHSTRNNGMRIVAVVALFPWAMNILLGLLSRDNATIYEQTTLGILMYLSAAIGIFALSLTYKELYRNK